MAEPTAQGLQPTPSPTQQIQPSVSTSSTSLRPSAQSALSTAQTLGQAKAEIEARLAGIHDDLQLTQTIGLMFVKRQEDLKSCYDQLQHLEAIAAAEDPSSADRETATAPLPEAFRDQLAALEKEFLEGQNGITGLKSVIDAQL
ncbi:hypothetical protein BGW38_008510, partial [Lunasporangiospora selenospora]